ncbi:MAG TPA: hypothetical protein VMS11_01195 [Solirubrobacterales bacterium]|nr:hypothetical protein [Solirubrobacterales bacterium]
MNGPAPKGGPRRLQREIVQRLADFPRQFGAFENAMAAFGEGFELGEFKRAFETDSDLDAYNDAQAVERGLTRVQGFVAELAVRGAKLTGLELERDGSVVERSFSALVGAGVIDASLSRRLKRAQRARSRIEHGYAETSAGEVHAAAELVHDAAPEFIGPFRRWIEPFLEEKE